MIPTSELYQTCLLEIDQKLLVLVYNIFFLAPHPYDTINSSIKSVSRNLSRHFSIWLFDFVLQISFLMLSAHWLSAVKLLGAAGDDWQV
jgi:hypothetical protein